MTYVFMLFAVVGAGFLFEIGRTLARVDRYGDDACKACPFIIYEDNGFSLENCVINYPPDWNLAEVD